MTVKLSTILNSQSQGQGNIAIIKENRDPLDSDTAILATMWINESTNRFFICTDATPGNTVWEAGAGGEIIATDTRDPNSSDLGNLGSVWINILTNKFFICTDETPGSTIWSTNTQKAINSSVDPTLSDYDYPLGTIWINASTLNQKTYFVLIDNTENQAIWSKNETDVFWVTDPLITGSTIVECDETLYTYNVSNSYSTINASSTITYNWSISNGVLSNTTGNSVNLYFTNNEKDSIQTLSCYAEDDLGYKSKVIEFDIQVRIVNPVDNLTLSLPNKICTSESSFFDVNVGYTGGDHNLQYHWQSSTDNINWTSIFFTDPSIKLSEGIFASAGVTYVRCYVTNLGGTVNITSGPIPTIDIVTDADSTYLDTNRHVLENKDYYGEMITSSKLGVKTVIFELNDRIIVNDKQDNVIGVTNAFDTQMNMVTDEITLNDDYTSYTSTTTLMGNKVLVAYDNSNVSGKGVIKVGTFNGDTMSFGDPVEFNNDYSQYIQILPLVDNKVIISYRDDGNNNLGAARVGTVTGNTITFGAEFVFNSVDTDYIDMCKIDDTRFAIAYSDYGTGNLGTLVVCQVSGDTITVGTQQVYTNSAYFNNVTLIDTDKLCICYQDDTNSNYGTAIIANVSGTTLTIGTPQVFNNNGYTNYIKVLKVDTNKIAITYQDVGTSGYGFAIVGTVSGTIITFGTAVQFEGSTTTFINSSYMNDKLVIAYQDSTNSGKINFGTITGTAISFETVTTFNEYESDFIQVFELDNKVVIVFKDGGDADKGKVMVFTPYKQEIDLETQTVTSDEIITRLNTQYVLPIIAQQPTQEVFEKVEMRVQTDRNNLFDVSEDNGKVILEDYEIEPYVVGDRLLAIGDTNVYSVISDINRSVITGTGASVSGEEDVFNQANTQRTAVTMLGDYIVTAFRDNSSAGSMAYGELVYGKIVFNNNITFTASDIDYVSIAKLSDDKAIIVYQDVADTFCKAFVAKIKDGNLMIGGVFQVTSSQTEYIDVAQLGTDSFIISFQDVGDLEKGKCIIGSASDMVLSFGSLQEFNTGNTTYTSITALTSTKVAISYRDIDNGGAGTVKIGNIVGLNATFGAAQVFYSGSTTYTDIEYLSANKVVIKFTDYTNNNYGSVIIGVVSGINVSFGSSVYFNNNETYYSNIVRTEDDVFMIVYDNYVGLKGYSRVGTVIGNVITFDSPVQINNGTTSHIDTVMVNNKKIIATYSDQGNNYKGTAQVIRRDIDLFRNEITLSDTLPTNIATVELLSYKLEASAGAVQSFESTEYYYTDLDEIYSVLNNDTLLTTATVTTSGSFFYSRLKSVNTDELNKNISRIDIDFWTQP